MNFNNTKDELEAWFEWKKLCDIKKCLKENQEKLNNYADMTLKQNIKNFSYSKLNASSFLPKTAFALFEMHALNNQYSKSSNTELNGKSYKDGMFVIIEKKDGKIKLIKTFFKYYLRTSIRECYTKEINSENTVSINKKIDNNTEFGDLLPSTFYTEKDFEAQEILELAEPCAEKIINSITFKEKAVILAKSLQIPYTSEILEKITEIKKSRMQEIYKSIYQSQKYIYIIKETYPKEPENIIAELYKVTLFILEDKIFRCEKPEKIFEPLFKESVNRSSNGGLL